MNRVHFTPISKCSENERWHQLSEASEFAYDTGGPATHIAFTDFNEVILLFPVRGEDDEQWRFALVFKAHHVDKFIEVAKAEQDDFLCDVDVPDDWACPDEWELLEGDLIKRGSCYVVPTNVTL